ncbi:DUF2786 domain-containing protein [Massilia sp. NR 4-1]|uniref:DUF2786 domain-containing protein n=1 Tax=Massilia sp. NR 4-1 TaxID=1678028 RepID=UPI00067CEDCC|nr:DUF2786 domain-containing protein [Massilia sp. NR 4-1]AKU21894.1 hypothetical protein ACZ75_10860 [Massilia sp. NR 4-1]
MDKETAIKKIRKCMALAKSSEPHEAAAAMRQAQKLMEQFSVEHPELLAAGAAEEWSKSSASMHPPRYEVNLASLICRAFGCEMVFKRQLSKSQLDIHGGYSFIATAPIPEIAAYSFTVLRRQLAAARADYIKTTLKRYRKNKTAAADLFCQGWVLAAQRHVVSVTPTEEQSASVSAYMQLHYAETSSLQSRERALTGRVDGENHVGRGWDEGKNARLNQGVSGGAAVAALAE